jgi:hypothetical protein
MTISAKASKPRDLPIEFLKRRLELSPCGLLIRKPRPETDFLNPAYCRAWNLRFAGKPAFITRTARGYLSGSIAYEGKQFPMLAHRVVFALAHGRQPKGEIDHIDGNPGNNAIGNLREATHKQNSANRISTRGRNTFPGTRRIGKRWGAYVYSDGRMIHIGMFDSDKEAFAAYVREVNRLRGAFSPTARLASALLGSEVS